MRQIWKTQLRFILVFTLVLSLHVYAADKPATGDPVSIEETVEQEAVISTEKQGKNELTTGIETESVAEDSEEQTSLKSSKTSQSKQLQIPDVPATQKKTKSSVWIVVVCIVISVAICVYLIVKGKKRSN